MMTNRPTRNDAHGSGVLENVDTSKELDADTLSAMELEFLSLRSGITDRDDLAPNRRQFLTVAGAGAGLAVTIGSGAAFGQIDEAAAIRNQGAPANSISARLIIDPDGSVTVNSGKVEFGQGARTQITQAAAEELGIPLEKIRVVLGDTSRTAGDGGTFASLTTSQTVPSVRRAAAAMRALLAEAAAQKLNVPAAELTIEGDRIVHRQQQKAIALKELLSDESLASRLGQRIPNGIDVVPTDKWKVLGNATAKVSGRDVVTGNKQYPSDIRRPGMMYGKVLRQPAFGATLESVDLEAAKAIPGVIPVRDGDFVGCVGPTTHAARQGIEALAKAAKWKMPDNLKSLPSSETLSAHLKATANAGGGRGGRGGGNQGSIEDGLSSSAKKLDQTYEVAYIAHAPMEPRAAVAEWKDGKVTVWQGSQSPTTSRGEVARAFQLSAQDGSVLIIVPDTGGGFGGKHSGDVAVEAARLAKAVDKPVSLTWTREEEFTWAYFRPATVIDVRGGLDAQGGIVAYEQKSFNGVGEAINTPYRIANRRGQVVGSNSPLSKTGPYRGLGATANTFARECFMDELAHAASADPVLFRLKHLDSERAESARLMNVVKAAAEKFQWENRKKNLGPNEGIGFACGPEKASYVAACVHVRVDRQTGDIKVLEVCQAYECGAIQNPVNLSAQVEGGLVMGLGGALSERVEFAEGRVTNPRFSEYAVPRMKDLPKLDIVLVDRPDLPSIGAGETPIIAVAPAISNAVFQATGVRLNSLPMKSEKLKLA